MSSLIQNLKEIDTDFVTQYGPFYNFTPYQQCKGIMATIQLSLVEEDLGRISDVLA
jgi:hypothetical protein